MVCHWCWTRLCAGGGARPFWRPILPLDRQHCTGLRMFMFSIYPVLPHNIFRLQFLVARELFRIAYVAQKSKRSLPLIRTQQWYFFFTAVFWLYLRYVFRLRNALMASAGKKLLDIRTGVAEGPTVPWDPGSCGGGEGTRTLPSVLAAPGGCQDAATRRRR